MKQLFINRSRCLGGEGRRCCCAMRMAGHEVGYRRIVGDATAGGRNGAGEADAVVRQWNCLALRNCCYKYLGLKWAKGKISEVHALVTAIYTSVYQGTRSRQCLARKD